MSNENIRFWRTQEIAKPVTLEYISEVISPQDAYAFARGLHQIYDSTKAVNPDVVFLPERGSAPFGWGLDYFGEKDGIRFTQVPVIIGTGTNVLTGAIGGQTKPEKQRNVERAVEIAINMTGNITNPLLIDEVQYGGTIRQASHYLHTSFENWGITVPLNVIAVEDSKKGGWEKKKAKGYKTLVSNKRSHIRSTVVRMPIFSIDRDDVLNRILTEPVPTDEKPMPMVMHNNAAREAIEMLLRIYSGDEVDTANLPNSSWVRDFQLVCQKEMAA